MPLLVVHGHIHRGYAVRLTPVDIVRRALSPILISNPGSSGYAFAPPRAGAFNLYQVEGCDGLVPTVTVRHFRLTGSEVEEDSSWASKHLGSQGSAPLDKQGQ
jgi:hypothetical protein